MALPIRATLEDIEVVCRYLSTKPTGASSADARRVLDGKHLDGRKLGALKRWGLIESEDGKFKVTELGRQAVKDRGAGMPGVLLEVLRNNAAYNSVIERAAHRGEAELSAPDVAAHWHAHHREEAGDNDEMLSDGAVAFFQLASGAGLGRLILGRKGAPTRLEFDRDAVTRFAEGGGVRPEAGKPQGVVDDSSDREPEAVLRPTVVIAPASPSGAAGRAPEAAANRVFITHGKNTGVLEQLKEIVRFGKFEPVVAEEHETPSKPVPDKVLDDMRSCFAGIIHVEAEEVVVDQSGKPQRRLNENVLIEIGAAMALYRRKFVLLVEEGTTLPSNLQGLYECRYRGSVLDGTATMKLLKIFNEIR